MTGAEVRKAAAREIAKRRRANTTDGVPNGFTLDAIARGANGELHVPQLGYMSSTALRILLMCSRRAGKTFGIAGRYAMRSVSAPNGNRAYIALTKDQAREIIWEPIWKPLCETWGLCSVDAHNETRMVTTFPNGSRVRFTGSDDLRHIATELGAAANEVTIDESQDQPGDVLDALANKILPPALGSRGVLTISGVFPEVQAGYYWKLREHGLWERHNWSMFDNPHYPDPQLVVDQFLAQNPHYSVDSPLVQRDYYGNPVYDESATAYRFNPTAHVYEPTRRERVELGPFSCLWTDRPFGTDRLIIGIDQAQRKDRFAIVGWTWDHNRKNTVYQLFEAITAPGGDPTESEWLEVLKEARRRYGPGIQAIRDAGGSSAPTNDLLKHSHGIIVESAIKGPGSVKARVERLSDLLVRGKAKAIADSELAMCLATARWSKEAQEKGKWELDKTLRSPDVSDAASYALGLPLFSEIGGKEPAPILEPHAAVVAAHQAYIDKLLRGEIRSQPKQPMRPTRNALWKSPMR